MTMKEEEKKRRRRRKKTILGFGGRRTLDMIFITEISEISHLIFISLSSLFLNAIGSARNQKKSSQNKRTFHYLRQNNNCIGHTLRRVSGRKRRKRERNAHVFLSSSQREKESLFLVPSIVSQRRDLNKMIFI